MENLWQHLIGNHRKCDDNCKYKLLNQTKTKPPRDHQLIRLENVNSIDKLMVRLNYLICTYRVHVTSSTKYPTFQFSNSKIFENQRARGTKIHSQTNSSVLNTMSTIIFCDRKLCDISAQEFLGPIMIGLYRHQIDIIMETYQRTALHLENH